MVLISLKSESVVEIWIFVGFGMNLSHDYMHNSVYTVFGYLIHELFIFSLIIFVELHSHVVSNLRGVFGVVITFVFFILDKINSLMIQNYDKNFFVKKRKITI
jgi:hypothetical protein